MPKKVAKKTATKFLKGVFGVVGTAGAAGKKLDKLFGTQNKTAFPLQKPTRAKRKSKGGGGK